MWRALPRREYRDFISSALTTRGSQADCHLIQHKGWVSGPGRPGQNLHLDFLPLAVPNPAPLFDGRLRVPIYLITAHYYLEDFTGPAGGELGPTLFVRGSHRSGRGPKPGELRWVVVAQP